MCKSQTLFYPQWFQGQECWQSHSHVPHSKLPCCPPPSLEHIICQRCKQRKSWGCPTAGCHEVWVRPCGVCPRSLHCPPRHPVTVGAACVPAAGDLLAQPQPCPNPAPNPTRQSQRCWCLLEAHRQPVSPGHSPHHRWVWLSSEHM